jgi:hypothetical protein
LQLTALIASQCDFSNAKSGFKNLVVRQDRSNTPGCYVQKAWSRCEQERRSDPNRDQTGTRVRVYYGNMGDSRVIDHVFVLADSALLRISPALNSAAFLQCGCGVTTSATARTLRAASLAVTALPLQKCNDWKDRF